MRQTGRVEHGPCQRGPQLLCDVMPSLGNSQPLPASIEVGARVDDPSHHRLNAECITMRSIQMSRFGGPEVFEVIETRKPEPGPGQVLVRVRAAGVNFADTLMRENRYALTPELPAVLGHEDVGVIEALGKGVSGLAVGARVAAPLFAAGTFFGGYAEYVLIDAGFLTPLPDALSFEDATALMVQGLTALYLTRQIPPQGKTVFVSAAAGGVGTLLVQLAKRAGAKTVIAAGSTAQK